MQKYLHLLERLGLREHERATYMTLLEHPYLTVSEIAQRTHVHRPAVYKSLRSLEADHLIEKSYLDGKRYYYHTTSPKKLKEKLERINMIADATLPELEAMYEKNSFAPILSVKEGIDGIKSIHEDLIESVPKGGIYYRYSASRVDYPGHSLYTPSDYSERQKKKELERVVITNEKNLKRRSTDPNRKALSLPRDFDTFDDNISKIIYANKVAFIDYDSQTGWVVESERFARYEEKIFRLVVKLLEEKSSR